jgi:hypothetical protein
LPPRACGCTRGTHSAACGGTTCESARHHSRWVSRCGAGFAVAQVRRASAAIAWRTVRFTGSIKAVFNLPERPHPWKAPLRAAWGSKTHHRREAHQLATPGAFLHLTGDQIRRHLPSEDFPPKAPHLEPVSEMGRYGIKVHVQTITAEERYTERRLRAVAENG